MATTKRKPRKPRPRRTAHLRQTDLSTSTGLKNAKIRLGENLRARRQTLELSQAELAAGVDLDQSSIAQVESGTHAPSFDSFLRLAHALKSTPVKLLLGVKL